MANNVLPGRQAAYLHMYVAIDYYKVNSIWHSQNHYWHSHLAPLGKDSLSTQFSIRMPFIWYRHIKKHSLQTTPATWDSHTKVRP